MKLIILTVLCAISLQTFGAEPLKLEEVLGVLRTNLTDMSEAELDRAAAAGLIKELGTRVQLVTTNAPVAAEESDLPEPISKTAVYEEKFAYVRVTRVDGRLTNEFHKTLTQLLGSNKLAGIVLDLRYAGGTNYQAAGTVADEFVRGGEPMLKLGEMNLVGTDRAADIRQPVAVLVNGETRAAAEGLAGILRESAAALVIGSKTAGEARVYELFPLSTGQKLRVGKVAVEVGRGKVLPAGGIVPDIKVSMEPDLERAYYEDPYLVRRFVATSGGTNELSGLFNQDRPLNEAELVKRHRSGEELVDRSAPAPSPEPSAITDPTLARALDFLKGLSILQPRR
ncbi:MAG: S41 family peptidase [Limisphaerales bacterium]